MKVVILAGGLGTRIAEESSQRPKPMIEIGGKPILWHIMRSYAAHGLSDFIICAGYKGYMIKEYFVNYFMHNSDICVDLGANSVEFLQSKAEPWRVTVVDTGEATMTGGRLKRVGNLLPPDQPFCFTYGDGVSDIDLSAEIDFHRGHGKQATLAAIIPPGRYGALVLGGTNESEVQSFIEKPPGDNSWINGGFFVLEPSTIDLIANDSTSWEAEPLERLAENGQLMAFRHAGFWQAMDTLRDKQQLEALWASDKAPWTPQA